MVGKGQVLLLLRCLSTGDHLNLVHIASFGGTVVPDKYKREFDLSQVKITVLEGLRTIGTGVEKK